MDYLKKKGKGIERWTTLRNKARERKDRELKEKRKGKGKMDYLKKAGNGKKGLYHRERILETSTLSCNEEEEDITKPPKR